MVDAEQALDSDPDAEFAAALLALSDSVGQSPAAEMSEAELIAAATGAKRSSRRARHRRDTR